MRKLGQSRTGHGTQETAPWRQGARLLKTVKALKQVRSNSCLHTSPSLSLSLDFSLEEVYIFREDVSRVLGGGRVGGGGVILVVLVLVLVLLFLLFLVLLLVEEVGLLRG